MLAQPFYYRLLVALIILASLLGCERDSYTTWSCNSVTEIKIPMVLRKAQMEFKGMKLDYCGSLGTKSFFNQKCPALIEQSSVIFSPASGLLVDHGQEFQCHAL
jgi:hypothetical protein